MSNHEMKHLFIEPLDVWLFRNGRPFNSQEDHTAQGTFPPFPSTMQGILRTHHLAWHGVNIHDQAQVKTHVGARHSYPQNFQLTGPFVACRQNGQVTRHFPLPQDVYLDGETYRTFTFKPEATVYTDLTGRSQLQLLYRHSEQEPQKDDSEGGKWLTETELDSYLRGKSIPKDKVVSGSTLFTTEARMGIGLNSQQRVTEEGKLYEVKFTRPREHVGLAIGVAGLDGWPPEGVLAVGGEARAGHYTTCSAWSPPHHLPKASGQFKILFLTPTYFEQGWQSENWGQFFAGDVQLVTAVVGRPLIWGGRDIATNKHEPSYRYVPAGSVYYFKGQPDLKLTTITDKPDQFGPIGFGQFAIGGW